MNATQALSDGSGNQLLRALPRTELIRVRPALERVWLQPSQVLQEQDAVIEHVHFLEQGFAVVMTSVGGPVPAGIALIGREGVIGLPIALGGEVSPHSIVMQTKASALRIDACAFRQLLATSPSLRDRLLLHAAASFAQTVQTAACNARHTLERRLARWLLAAHDLVGQDELRLTHDRLSRMLGVRRAGITVALHMLEGAKIIRSTRGRLIILDREKLQAASCGCHGLVMSEFGQLMH